MIPTTGKLRNRLLYTSELVCRLRRATVELRLRAVVLDRLSDLWQRFTVIYSQWFMVCGVRYWLVSTCCLDLLRLPAEMLPFRIPIADLESPTGPVRCPGPLIWKR